MSGRVDNQLILQYEYIYGSLVKDQIGNSYVYDDRT